MVVFGPDFSHYQDGVDLDRVVAEGHQFMLAKITQGVGYRDASWPAFRDGARKRGLLLAGYHFVTTEPAAAQAANCLAWIGDRSIPVALDWESGSGDWANFEAVLAAFRAVGLHVALAYAPRWYWQQQGSPDMSRSGLTLWSSRYVGSGGAPAAVYSQVGPAQWTGYGGLPVGLVQFTDKATVAGIACDCSAFLGTRAQLAVLLGYRSPTQRKAVDVTPPNYTVQGTGSIRLGCPVGSKSDVVARAWVSALCDGPTAGSVHYWFQDDDGGISDEQHTVPFADGHSGRALAQFPDGATQVNVQYSFATTGTIFLETEPK